MTIPSPEERAHSFVVVYVHSHERRVFEKDGVDDALFGLVRNLIAADRRQLLAETEEAVETITREVFLRHKVYEGYDDATKEREWHRMRGIELIYARHWLATLRRLYGVREGVRCSSGCLAKQRIGRSVDMPQGLRAPPRPRPAARVSRRRRGLRVPRDAVRAPRRSQRVGLLPVDRNPTTASYRRRRVQPRVADPLRPRRVAPALAPRRGPARPAAGRGRGAAAVV